MPDSVESPYQRIAGALRERIRSGELAPGDRVPSTRAIVQEWGVAMVTAAKALGVLQQEGLVEAHPGMGTVVRAGEHIREPRRTGGRRQTLTRGRIVAEAIAIADAEGLDALSMRRLATALDVGPMTLYRHVAGKDELVYAMVRELMAAHPLPAAGPGPWRPALELVCRLQWHVYRAHHWLAGLMSTTRPMLAPEAMAHSEWVLRALHGLGLPAEEVAREALTLPAFVRGMALSMAGEVEAERETGMSNPQWWQAIGGEVQHLLGSGAFPHLAHMPDGIVDDLDGQFEHGLARHLDGLQARLEAVP
jgi:DNA-binding transcriptional regulator YhcF (GntR family)